MAVEKENTQGGEVDCCGEKAGAEETRETSVGWREEGGDHRTGERPRD